MTSYTVKAPDGKMVTLEGPAGASQADIIAQAQALYKPKTAAPAAPKVDSAASLKIYNGARGRIAAKFTDPAQRDYALTKFDSDPRVQAARKAAGLAPLSTAKGEVKAIAKKQSQQLTLSDLITGDTPKKRFEAAGADVGKGSTGFQSAAAGIARGMFGLPERLAAAGERFLPTAITGNKTDASYDNILQMIRAKDTAAIDANPGAGIAGEFGGGIVGVGGAGKLVAGAGRRLAATGAPVVARIGNVLESLSTLRKGRKLANAGKLIVAGGAGGGAQAAGEGSDVPTGVALGAVAAPVVAGGFKAAQALSRPFRDLFSAANITSGKSDRLLRRLTTASRDQLERLATAYRDATGAEPTLFELLPLADRNKILKTAIVGKDNVVEQTANAIRGRAQNLGPEMSARARQILQPQRDFIHQGLRRDITQARGGQLADGDEEMIANAMESPTDMLHLRDQEARAIMAPHDETAVTPNLEDLFPHVPGPEGTRVDVDPEVSTVIRSAAGTMRQRATGAGVTVGDITSMISKISGDIGKGGTEGRTAERAVTHLHDMLDEHAPEAGAAARQMTEAYAARSRMAEGMQEGSATRLRDDVQVGTSRKQARTVRNAYDSPEGSGGRSLGQGNRVITDLGGSPEEALRSTIKMSRNSTGRQVSQNIGTPEAEQIAVAARAQDESAQALASASSKAQSGSGDNADGEMLVQALAGFHPSTFITTKANAWRRLYDLTYIPENRARTIVDMLFSQDPAITQRALNAVGNEPNGATFLKYLAGVTGQTAAKAGVPDFGSTKSADETPTAEADVAAAGSEETPPPEEPQPPAVDGDSPYVAQLQQIYSTENPDLLNLIGRVKAQESGGDQSLVSKKGAVGVMQVMPDTGPEAAALAGLPWDENAYKTDPAYNELIGIAYLSQQLRKYKGNVARALAAYNAGPDRTDDALQSHGENFLAALPAETQDYVARIGA